MQPGKILEKAARGVEIFITYRGKTVAKLVPLDAGKKPVKSHKMFAMWKNHDSTKSVEQEVRDLREGRKF